MKPGEIVWVLFPFSSKEQQPYKRRPVVVVNATGTGIDQAVLVAMVTSNARRVAHPGTFDVVVENWSEIGLVGPSVVRVNRIWTAESRDLAGSLGRSVSQETLLKIRKCLSDLIGPSE